MELNKHEQMKIVETLQENNFYIGSKPVYIQDIGVIDGHKEEQCTLINKGDTVLLWELYTIVLYGVKTNIKVQCIPKVLNNKVFYQYYLWNDKTDTIYLQSGGFKSKY